MRKIIVGTGFVVAWSSGFVGATLGQRAASPAPLLAWRYLVTALILWAGLLATSRGRRDLRLLRRRDVAQQVVLGLLAHVLFLGGVFGAAAAGLDAGVSSLICALQPMLVAAAGRLWFTDSLSGRQWFGLGLGMAGVALSVGAVRGAGLTGVWMVVVSLLALSAAALLERRWQPDVSVTASLTVQTSVAAVVFPVCARVAGGLAVRPTPTFGLAVVWLVLLSGLGGYAGFTASLRRLGATTTSTLLYVTPPVTSLWAWAMFGQAPTGPQVVALVVVLAGVALVIGPPRTTASRRSRRNPLTPTPEPTAR